MDDVVSGRMTPTLPEAFPGGVSVEGASAPLVGGLLRLQAAVILAPLLPPEPPLLELSEPQAASPPEPMMSANPRAA